MPPRGSQKHVPTYTVMVNGSKIGTELANRVREIRVEDSLGLPDVCTVLVGFQRPDEGQGHDIDKHPFTIGQPLEVRLGETDTQTPETLFKGEILTLEPSFGSGGIEMRVRAYDKTHRLHRSRNSKSWQDKSASDIVGEILGRHSVKGKVDSSSTVFKFMQQNNETDWDFIWRLAHRCGFEVKTTDDKVDFVKPGKGAAIDLEWMQELRSFNPRVTGVQQVAEVTVAAHDPKTDAWVMGTATTPDEYAQIGLQRNKVSTPFGRDKIHVAVSAAASQDEAKAMAQSLLDRIANSYVAADGLCFGNPKIRAGTIVNVSKVGTTFSGKYRVQSTIHLLKGGGGYETLFSSFPTNTVSEVLGLNNGNGRVNSFADQIVVAKVTNINDPDKMGRVKLKYPALSDQLEGNWARIATPGAGKERGLLMRPKVNDEVLVAFANGDTSHPYVIGALHHGKYEPGDEMTDKESPFVMRSDDKMITRAKKAIELEGGETYTVKIKGDVTETFEAKLTTTVSGECKIEVKQGGMTISSMGATKIESKASMELKATGGVTVDGTSMVTVKGGQIMIG